MATHTQRKNGFTIIEVLIVLAIAGLIILIVFMAIPALQRNARNTQRKNDVTKAFGTFMEAMSNNGGKLPPSCLGGNPSCFLTKIPMSIYDNQTNAVAFSNNSPAAPDTLTPRYGELLQFTSGAKCVSDDAGATTTGASSRSVVALYAVETVSGSQSKCQDL